MSVKEVFELAKEGKLDEARLQIRSMIHSNADLEGQNASTGSPTFGRNLLCKGFDRRKVE